MNAESRTKKLTMLFCKITLFLKPFVEGFMVLLFSSFIAMTFLQVVLRYVFHSSLFWGEEFIKFAFTWCIFLGAALAVDRSQHFNIDFITGYLPEKYQKILRQFAQISILLVVLFFIFEGIKVAFEARAEISLILRMPMIFVYASIPLSMMYMLLCTIRNILLIQAGEQLLKADDETAQEQEGMIC